MIRLLEHRLSGLIAVHPFRAAGLVAAVSAPFGALTAALLDGPVLGGAVGAAVGAFAVMSTRYRAQGRTHR